MGRYIDHIYAEQGISIPQSASTGLVAISDASGGVQWNQVGTTGIQDDAVTSAKIATDAVGSPEIAADAVGSTEIATDAVGSAEIAANAVGSSELADNAVDTAAIQASAVTGAKIATGTSRLQPYRAGKYIGPITMTRTTAIMTNGRMFLIPFLVNDTITFDRMAVAITVAGATGSVIRLGIYSDTGLLYPNALILDAGTVAGTAVAVPLATISQALTPNWYWIAAVGQGAPATQPTIRSANVGVLGMVQASDASQIPLSYFMDGVTGALPATFTETGTSQGMGPLIQMRMV